jgi:hypothetical protein
MRIGFIVFVAGSLMALSGCAGSGTGNSAGITYTMVGNLNITDTAKAADKHCAQYGKVAKLEDTGNLMAYFSCVAP